MISENRFINVKEPSPGMHPWHPSASVLLAPYLADAGGVVEKLDHYIHC